MAWALVQDEVNSDSGVGSINVTFGASCVAGNLAVVAVSCQDTDGTKAATCTVGGVAAAQAITTHNPSLASGWRIWTFYLVLAAGGAHTVTVTFNASAASIRCTIAEFSGNAASSVLDKTAGATGNSAVPSSGNVTPDSDGQLLMGYAITQSGVIAPGSGFTSFSPFDGFDEPEFLEQGSAVAIDADWTADSHEWVAQVATFRAPAVGGGTGIYPIRGMFLLLDDEDLQFAGLAGGDGGLATVDSEFIRTFRRGRR